MQAGYRIVAGLVTVWLEIQMLPSCLVAALLALSIITPLHAQESQPILIRFAHVVADDTPKGKGALLFKQLAEGRLAGKVRVEVYPNSTRYGDADEMQALLNGQVELLAPSLSKFDRYTKQLQVFDLPFLFDDAEAVKRFGKREKSQELLRSMTSHGITGLAYWSNGLKQLSANRALRLPKDAQGLKFRIQNSAVLESQFESIGAQAVRLAFGQMFKGLESGEVQGAENPWSNIVSQKVDTVQSHIIESNHGVLHYMLITNTSFWHSLPYAIRSELDNIILEVTHVVNAEAEALNARDRQKVLAAGRVKVIDLSDAEREAWRQAMLPVWKRYEDEIGTDVIRAALAVNRKR